MFASYYVLKTSIPPLIPSYVNLFRLQEGYANITDFLRLLLPSARTSRTEVYAAGCVIFASERRSDILQKCGRRGMT
jgi:hypothetical protein